MTPLTRETTITLPVTAQAFSSARSNKAITSLWLDLSLKDGTERRAERRPSPAARANAFIAAVSGSPSSSAAS